MFKKFITSVLFILGVGFIAESSSIYASNYQESARLKDFTQISQSLVGEKCTIFLKNGEQITGTLWSLGEDYLTVKVKKGPLYSKEEKFGYSEIDYLEDANGKRIEVAQLYSQKPSTSNLKPSNSSGKNTIPIFIKTEKKTSTEAPQEPEITTHSSDINTEPKDESQINEEQARASEKATPELHIVTPTYKDEHKASKNSSKSLSAAKTPKTSFDSKNKSQIAKAQGGSESGAEVEGPLTAEYKKLRILKYQIIALFSATILALALMVVLKIKGMAGYSYGKHSLFPSRLVKINGKYGVIDQGSDDGVEVDDIIWLHRKVGRSIKYVGKAKIIKVVKNYAAIQLVKDARHGPAQMGDVGFRDRSLILSAVKIVRTYVGNTLKGLAKGLEIAAKTLSAKPEYAEKEITIIASELRQKQSKKSGKKSKSQNGNTLKSTKQPQDETTLVGFGLEDG